MIEGEQRITSPDGRADQTARTIPAKVHAGVFYVIVVAAFSLGFVVGPLLVR